MKLNDNLTKVIRECASKFEIPDDATDYFEYWEDKNDAVAKAGTDFIKEHTPFEIQAPKIGWMDNAVDEWCEQYVVGDYIRNYSSNVFHFSDKDDAMRFKLRWA